MSGDKIVAERIYCKFRRKNKEKLVHGSGSHRARVLVIEGSPAESIVLKPWKGK